MGTFLGIFIAAFALAWAGVNIVRNLWFDVNNAVETTTFLGIFTGAGTKLTMDKAHKTADGWTPKLRNLTKVVHSLIGRG